MRFLPILIASAAAITAQSPLTTTFVNNNGGAVGGAVYFELTDLTGTGVTVTEFDLNFGAAVGTAGSIDVYTALGNYDGNQANAAFWGAAPAVTGLAIAAGAGLPTNCPLSGPIVVPANGTVAVCIVAVGLAHAYTNGVNPSASGGDAYTNADLTLIAGSGSNAPFLAPTFDPRVVNTNVVYTTGGGAGSFATADSIGAGCISEAASLYQFSDMITFAASNTLAGIDYINTGAGYIVTASAGSINPINTLDPLAVPEVGVGDDFVAAPVAGTLGLEYSSNGFLALGTGNANAWAPSTAQVLDQPAAAFFFWADFQPNTGGTILYEESGTQARLTYDQVLAWGTTDVNTFQFDIDTATGNASLYFGALASATAHGLHIGYSPAGPNIDLGSTDIEAELASAGAIVLAGSDTAPLTMTSGGRPVQGAAPAAWDMTTAGIDANAIFHLGLVGLSNPNFPLSLLGLPGACTQYANADIIIGPAVVAGGTGSYTWTAVTLPSLNPALNGFELYTQAATLDLSILSSTTRVSNGIKGTIGDI